MVKALFDTNILIDYLNAVPQARDELDRYESRYISIITWMEVLIGATPDVADATRAFLASITAIPLDDAVAERAVELRHDHGLGQQRGVVRRREARSDGGDRLRHAGLLVYPPARALSKSRRRLANVFSAG